MALYSGYIIVWALLNPERQPPRRAADDASREKLRESANLIPCLLLILLSSLTLLLGWATATECAAWGVLGSFAHRLVVAARSTWATFCDSVMGATRAHLHDHADPCRRVLHLDVDGLHRHPGGARRLGRQPAPLALRADRARSP